VACASSARAADPVSLTLLHTNDLHSHFRGENNPLGLGGVARIRTAVKKIRGEVEHSLFVDGGDWSEGNIYFTEGGGAETLKMMDFMGYDVAVVGNHDWLNGPDHLLEEVRAAALKMSVIATNVGLDKYDSRADFQKLIPPYVIKEVAGVKIAFIGLLTYEFIYDGFFKPVTVLEPFATTRALAHQLKQQADAVIVISHNAVGLNRALLADAPDVDLVIGAHDHVKLTKPEIVERPGFAPAWVVETGSWGRYLGRIDLRVLPRSPDGTAGGLDLGTYQLIQMDASVPEDKATLVRVEDLEKKISNRMGPIFDDHVGDSELELGRSGLESPMGDFATDAYRAATGADASIDEINFIYNELHEGAIRTVDVFNSNPGMYDAAAGKSWTLHTLDLSGKTLHWLFNLMFGNPKLGQYSALDFSGIQLVLSSKASVPESSADRLLFTHPGYSDLATPFDDTSSGLVSVMIGGEPLDLDRTYHLALPGSVVEALKYLDSILPNAVSLDTLVDTGREDWRAMVDQVRTLTPITRDKLGYGSRVVTTQPDLGVTYDDVVFTPSRSTPDGMLGTVAVTVRNYGQAASAAGANLHVLLNANGADYSSEPAYGDAAGPLALPSLAPGESHVMTWDAVTVRQDRGVYAITVRISGNDGEFNRSNDEVTRWFAAAR
jgi:2',3'-cyclic-nucleotide 2'-phosphodiesterase (5'-nucleotidase family)